MVTPYRQYCYNKKNAKRRQDYWDCKAKGICVNCKEKPALEGELYCEECLLIIKKRLHDYRARCTETQRGKQSKRNYLNAWRYKRRLVLEALGLCTRCEVKPAGEGFKMCDDCRAEIREMHKQRRLKEKLKKQKQHDADNS